jgi:F0F1-type ATP synthase membrane subunit b/b'
MKKSVLILAVFALAVNTIITGCDTPAQKVENAQENVDASNKQLDQANQDYQKDIDSYRIETADKFAANDKSLADFRARIKDQKADAKADYEKKLAELERKNTDMKKQMDDYKADGKDKWETFKTGFSKSMDDLGQSFKDLAR